ncbi:MAG: ligase-associated DNA damage response endonuclease PdeM [Pirellulales bacterium]
MTTGDLSYGLFGERVSLLREGIIHWPAHDVLLAADLHLGKDATFRSQGIAVPSGAVATTLHRLSTALTRSGARRLCLLGDLWHARAGRQRSALELVEAWRAEHEAIEIVLIRGNHDRQTGDPPAAWRMETVDGPWPLGGWQLWHEPPGTDLSGFHLAGHLHPCVRIDLGPGSTERPRGFWIRPNQVVLPAVGAFTGGRAVRLGPDDRFLALVDETVCDVTELTRSTSRARPRGLVRSPPVR